MRAAFLEEPELEFGSGKHVDIRFGIMNHGPLDYASGRAPKTIRVGIVGTPETVEGVSRWLERCRGEVPAKVTKQPNLFPRFPGFTSDTAFQATVELDNYLQEAIPQREFDRIIKESSGDATVVRSVERFLPALERLAEIPAVNVVVCALPLNLLQAMDPDGPGDPDDPLDAGDEPPVRRSRLNFHHMLKARALKLKIPLQIVLPMTYDETKRRRLKRRQSGLKQLQDEATRAWNFHTALYYKAGGVPWRLVRDTAEYTACYVGISFYKSLDESTVQTSMAQVFNERGEGVIVRGGPVEVSKEDRRPHLSASDAFDLLDMAFGKYRAEHRNLPARIVVHKTSRNNAAELNGFQEAIGKHGVDLADLLSLSDFTRTRLYRIGAYPPLRGTILSLDESSHVLYTKGSVDFFATYPGMYVPRSLGFRCESTEQTPIFLAREILALTKMNWNTTQFDGGEPITVRAARQVGGILKYVGEDDFVAPAYRFYM